MSTTGCLTLLSIFLAYSLCFGFKVKVIYSRNDLFLQSQAELSREAFHSFRVEANISAETYNGVDYCNSKMSRRIKSYQLKDDDVLFIMKPYQSRGCTWNVEEHVYTVNATSKHRQVWFSFYHKNQTQLRATNWDEMAEYVAMSFGVQRPRTVAKSIAQSASFNYAFLLILVAVGFVVGGVVYFMRSKRQEKTFRRSIRRKPDEATVSFANHNEDDYIIFCDVIY